MAGHFYPLPPTFIGGRQPYAPKLGQVQSGPAAASGPPPINRASFQSIDAWHRHDPCTTIYVCSIAPQLSAPAVPDNPPVRSYANQRAILGHWNPVYRPLPSTIKVAPLLPAPAAPDNAPVVNRTNLSLITRQWERYPLALPQSGRVAPLLPAAVTPDAPPILSYAHRNLVIAQWIPPQWRPLPALKLLPQGTPPDTTPDAFSFTDQSGVALSSTITSAAITIAGIDAASVITVSGGTYSINGGAFTASAGTVINGDQVQARHTSSASYLTATNTVVTIGGGSDTFTSTTRSDPALAGGWTYGSLTFNDFSMRI